MGEQNKKPGAAFWATVVVIALLVMYPLSFGPACWISSRTNTAASVIPIVYRPIVWCMAHNRGLGKVVKWYGELGAGRGWQWVDFSDSAISTDSFFWMHLDVPSP
jgi:hypothetical protein